MTTNADYGIPTRGEYDDPLAIRVGEFVGVDDMPEDGWPDTFDPDVVARILRCLPDEDAPPNDGSAT